MLTRRCGGLPEAFETLSVAAVDGHRSVKLHAEGRPEHRRGSEVAVCTGQRDGQDDTAAEDAENGSDASTELPRLPAGRCRGTIDGMSLGTAGAVQDAIRRMSEANRAANALGAGRVYARVFDARADPEFEAFPCGLLCMECRYLADPPKGDPMRTDATTEALPPCPHCGSVAWADLRNADAKAQIGEVDAFDQQEAARGVRRRITRLVLGGAIAAALVALSLVGWTSEDGLSDLVFSMMGLVVIFGPIVGMVTITMTSGFSVASKRRRCPARWRMAAPWAPPRRGVQFRGAIEVDEPVRAPLTGRACAAYEIGVRLDARSKAPPATWHLLEQGHPPLRLDQAALGMGQAYLHLPREAIERSRIVLDDEALSQFLRARGLDPIANYTYFESLVPVGASCRLFAGKGKYPPVLERTA